MACVQCSDGLSNTGVPSCMANPDIASKIIIVPKYGSTGSLNSIPWGQTINQTYIDSKINAVNPLDRWFPIEGTLATVESTRGDNVTEDVDGINYIIRQGYKSFSARNYTVNPQVADLLNDMGCKDFGIYIMTISTELQGKAAGDKSVLYPLPVERGTWSVTYMSKTESNAPYMQIDFTFSKTLRDGDVYFFPSTSITGELSEADGLIDITISNASTPTTTSFTFEASGIYGDASVDSGALALPITGLPAEAVELYNVTQDSTVALATLVEGDDGHYTATYTAQTDSDVMIIRSARTSSVYDVAGYEITPLTLSAIGS